MIYYKIEMHHNEKNLRIPVPDAVRSLLRFQPDHADNFKHPVHRRRHHQSKRVVGHPLSRLRLLSDDQHLQLRQPHRPQARRADQKSGMPFPASRYEFRENHLEVYSLPKSTRESTLAYNEFEKLGEDRDYFYLFRDSYGGYMVPKRGLTQARGPVQIRMRARI